MLVKDNKPLILYKSVHLTKEVLIAQSIPWCAYVSGLQQMKTISVIPKSDRFFFYHLLYPNIKFKKKKF